jgi:glycosyltransferase involved in cell wall biosynthesis
MIYFLLAHSSHYTSDNFAMDISVIVCTYNRTESLKRALNSLNKMSVPRHLSWELIVVDNNSKDKTRDAVEKFRLDSELSVRYVFEGNQGISHARNSGLKEAKGDVIAFIDDDVTVDRKWISNVGKAFREDGISCVGGKILPVFEKPRPKWLTEDLYKTLALLDYGDQRFHLTKPIIWGANFAAKASMFHKYGKFNLLLGRTGEKLYIGEETEFIKRLLENGETVLYAPNIVVHHHISAERLNKSYFRKRKYDEGELAAIGLGNYENRNILGIPYYEIRFFLKKVLKYLSGAITCSENRFRYELAVIYSIGFFVGRLMFRGRVG